MSTKSKKPNTVTLLTENDYSTLDPREHVYQRNGMYVGSDKPLEREDWVFDFDKQIMKFKTIDFIPALERIYVEIVDNAADHNVKSKDGGYQGSYKVIITMDEQWISVKNFGIPVPLGLVNDPDRQDGPQIHLPECIFARLRSSSHHLEKERKGIGQNGCGSKLCNIYSKTFNIEVCNHVVGKRYTQSCHDNMKRIDPPSIDDYDGETSSVKLSYLADFKRFKIKSYNAEARALFARHACDIAYTMKCPVSFNDIEFEARTIKEHAKMYFGDAAETAIVHYQYPKKKNSEPNVELLILDTPDEGTHVSFVEAVATTDGGVHVESAYRAIGQPILNIVNEPLEKKLKDMDGRAKQGHLLKLQNVKKHVSILLFCRLDNPAFQCQRKSFLVEPTPDIDVPDKSLEPIKSWQLISRLNHDLNAKQSFQLAKTDGKMTWHVKDIEIKGFQDADYAGCKGKAQGCTLCPAEGLSATGYLRHYISSITDGNRYYGILPLRGKCLNVRNFEEKRITGNKEIQAIKKILGLKEGLDYTIPENYAKLRYGKILIFTDSDLDGKHINGLILNIFHCRFPSLLNIPGFINYKRTPIVRMTKGKQQLKFYTQQEYDTWFNKIKIEGDEHGMWYQKHGKSSNFQGWVGKYFKGLGTSTKSDIIDDKKDEKCVEYLNDPKAPDCMDLAFNKQQRDTRKIWLMAEQQQEIDSSAKIQKISDFINDEFIHFSRQANIRAIPKMMDGLKESQRKVLAGAYREFKIAMNKKYETFKVADLQSYVSTEMIYHHNGDVLGNVITLMAQDFMGSNNINLFVPDGQFGSRYMNGEDAASARYIHTVPSDIVPYIFHDDDKNLLTTMYEEGKAIEPSFFLPLIPFVLCNGAHGIGTGFSTFIPCHDPLIIIQWLKLRLTGSVEFPSLKPYYRGFKGEIIIIDRSKNKEYKGLKVKDRVRIDPEMVDEMEIEVPSAPATPALSFVTSGIYYVEKDTIIITELPIGLSPEKYKDKLDKWLDEKRIKRYHNLCDADNVRFEIKGFDDTPSYKNLCLQRRYTLSNMVLLDKNNKPVKYNTAADIMESFYTERLPYYAKRKETQIDHYKVEITKLRLKIRFLDAILQRVLIVQNTPKITILEKMKQLDLPESLYTNARLEDINKDSISTLNIKIKQLESEHDKLMKLTPADLWLNDLKLLETKYRSMYKI